MTPFGSFCSILGDASEVDSDNKDLVPPCDDKEDMISECFDMAGVARCAKADAAVAATMAAFFA